MRDRGSPRVIRHRTTGIAYLPAWSTIPSGNGGLVIGGIIVWFIMRRKKITAYLQWKQYYTA